MDRYRARYYSGNQVNPFDGEVTLEESELIFRFSDGNEEAFFWREIERVEKLGSDLYIYPRRENSNVRSAKIVLFYAGKDKAVWKAWEQKISSPTNLARHRMSVLFKGWFFPAGLVLFLLVLALYSWGLSHTYLLVPKNVDSYVGSVSEHTINAYFDQCPGAKAEELKATLESQMAKMVPPDSNYSYQLTILKSDMVNAFALPGGRVYIFSGLLEKSNSMEEITGVLAHEMAHVEKRHGMKQISRAAGLGVFSNLLFGAGIDGFEWAEALADSAAFGVLLKYSRGAEEEADRLAIGYLHRAGLSAQGLLDFMILVENIEKEMNDVIGDNESAQKAVEIFSTHPATSKRIEYLRKEVKNEHFDKSLNTAPALDWKKSKMVCQE